MNLSIPTKIPLGSIVQISFFRLQGYNNFVFIDSLNNLISEEDIYLKLDFDHS